MPMRALVPTSRSRDPPRPMMIAFCDDRSTKTLTRMSSSGLSSGRSGALHHLLDHDGEGVRQLVADALQGGLADQLGDHHDVRLVGQLPLGVERAGRRRQVGRQHLRDVLDLAAVDGRAGHDGGPVAELVDRDEVLGQPLAVDGVDLGRDGDDRSAPVLLDLLELTGDEAVARPDPLVGRQAEPDDVDLEQGLAHDVVEPLAQQGPGLVQPRGVDEHQLARRGRDDPADGVPGGLRLRRGDRDLVPDEGVGQRRLPGVGAPDETGEPGDVALGVGAVLARRSTGVGDAGIPSVGPNHSQS